MIRIEMIAKNSPSFRKQVDEDRIAKALKEAGLMGQGFASLRPAARGKSYDLIGEFATLRQAQIESQGQEQDRIFRKSVDPKNPTTRVWVEEDPRLPDGRAS